MKMMKHWILSIVFCGLLTSAWSEQPEVRDAVPEWAKYAVWYQIFPDRFWNGDQRNDPTLEDMVGAWPYFRPEKWKIHPWTSDWFKLQSWEKLYDAPFYTAAGLRRYGGDLQGVLERLDYLMDLGVTAIYFNPLFESPSHHKYDAAMYHHIDNNFGPDPRHDRQIWGQENPADPATWKWTAADRLFLELIRQCHQRGMKVIIDGVFNHVGVNFWAFQDVIQNQFNSPYGDWFIIKRWDDPSTLVNEFDYQGWSGIRDLPEFREDERGLVEGPRQHIRAVVQRWMDPDGDGDPSDGIDGWRLDVAEKIDMDFWRDFRRWVKSINPEALLVGEIWWEDWMRNKMFNAAPWLQGDIFDGVMNYRFARAVKKFVIDQRDQISAGAFVDSLQTIYSDYPRDPLLVCQNLMDSHDVDRLASQLVNPDRWYDHGANPAQNPEYDVRSPDSDERLRQRLIVGLQMTLPGAPMIYYGDEAGMWGGDDPDCRKPMVWPKIRYESEKNHPFGRPRREDRVQFDKQLFKWYQQLIALRKNTKELSTGEIEFVKIDNEKKVLVFRRFSQLQSVFVALNNQPEAQQISFSLSGNAGNRNVWVDQLSRAEFPLSDGKIGMELKPYQIVVLLPKD
ncbi:MAG: glycoside hydrolase family 13 protein [Calditrichia bacterium]